MRTAVPRPATAAAGPLQAAIVTPAEESLRVAILLSLAGGFLDAFTWIAHHGVMANAQTANVVLLGVHAASAEWSAAFRFVPPIAAFVAAVFIICRLRVHCDDRGRYFLALLTIAIEIGVLLVALILHARLPDVAGTVGISFAAAMQTASFSRVEGRAYSSVMVTGNLRHATETFVAGWIDKHDPGARRQAKILVLVCFTFALGAGVGAVLTRSLESNARLVPIALLLAALTLRGRPLRRDSDIRDATHG